MSDPRRDATNGAVSAPVVSVVVPTHNRRASLERLLIALGLQQVPMGFFEVIIVADGCRDDTAAAAIAHPAGFLRRVIEQAPSGAAAARNRGANEARGEILVFLDDDMTPSPGLIVAYHRALQGRTDTVALGPATPALDEPLNFFQQSLRLWWAGLIDRLARAGHRFGFQDMLSGNFAIGARLFHRVGGFDTELRCREDYELGARLIEAGARFVWVPQAIALHHDATGLDASLLRARAEGRADIGMLHRHGALAPLLGLGSPEHPGPTAPLARLALSHPALGTVLANQLRQLLRLLEWLRMRRWWRAVYGAVRGFWYWRGAADELTSRRELGRLLHASRSRAACALDPSPVELNLQDGLEAAESVLERLRPATVRLQYGRELVGILPTGCGVERLHGGHLRPALSRELAGPLLAAAAVEHAVGLSPQGAPRWLLPHQEP